MALDCLAWLMRMRGRVVAEGCIIGRGFASPLTYSLTVAVTFSSLMWVNEGSLHAQGLAYMTSTHPPPRHHPLRTSRECYDTTEREARAAATRGLSCPWELSSRGQHLFPGR